MDAHLKPAPKVSILMCTYNRAGYLPQAIGSVLAQDFGDWELIVMDDASTDATAEVMASYAHDPRVRYVRNPINLGLGGNRVAALKEARGEYVAILDSDDLWNDAGKLGRQVSFLDEHADYALIGTMGIIIDHGGAKIGTLGYATDDAPIRSRILSRQQFLHSSVLFRREAALEAGGYDASLAPAEDYDFILKIGSAHKMANLAESSASYRIHPGNTSSSERAKKIRHAELHLSIIRKFKHAYPNYLIAAIKAHLRILKCRLYL